MSEPNVKVVTPVIAIKEYFSVGPNEVSLTELKALTPDERKSLAMEIAQTTGRLIKGINT